MVDKKLTEVTVTNTTLADTDIFYTVVNPGSTPVSGKTTIDELRTNLADRARANHTGTQAASTISDFDTEVTNNSTVVANTAKVTNATHTGDVTGSSALTIAADAVNDTHIDWGTGANQVSAVDIVIADSGVIITATEVEGALQENRTAINLNTSKVTNATHTGEVTGATALTIADNIVDEANLKVNSPTNDYILTADSGEAGGMKWAASPAGAPEGTAVLSTGETGGVKYLREDGDNTCSWQVPAGSGDVSKVGTPVNSQVGVWTGDGTIEGAASLTYDGSNFQLTGDIGSTGTRITKGWFTDLQATNAIAADITGNSVTVTGYTPASGSLTLAGADALTITTSGVTGVTLPTSGTLMANLVEDTTPQLGANLDIQAFNIEGAVAADFTKLAALTATSTELNYVDGVTSAIQTQLGTKITDPMTTRGDVIIRDATNTTARLAVGGNTEVLTSDGTDISWGAAGAGTVTSVIAGDGMNFTTITSSGTATLGTPGNLDATTSNATTATSHTHNLVTGITTNDVVMINSSTVADDEYARFTTQGLESRSVAEVLSDIGAAPVANPTFTGEIGIGAVNVSETELGILEGALLTTTELNYVDGVTSAIQTQMDTKSPIANPTFTGEIGIGAVNVSETELGILEGATLTTTELNYVDGVTSAIQTQLGTKMADLVDDTTPDLGGELDCGAHSVGFTIQSSTGDGTTTVDWKLGNKIKFTFGAFNETFTFTAPSNPCAVQMILVQDGTGSRTATWPASVKWPSGTAPTLTTTGTTGTDIVSLLYDGTNYYGVGSNDFS